MLRRAAAAGVLAALVACSGNGAGPTVRNGGTIYVSLPAAATSLNPLVARDVASMRAYTPLFPLLYAAQADLSVAPSLASAQPTYADGGKTLTVPLRTDARWSDGTAIIADDVVYTVTAELNPHLQTQAAFNWGPLTAVAKVDAHTVRFSLSTPDAAFLADQLLTPIVPQHALASVDPAHMATDGYSSAPKVTGGPFVFSHRDAANTIFLDANPSYFLGKPHADHLVELVGDDTTAPTLLGEGKLSWDPQLSPASAGQAIVSSGVAVNSYADTSLVAVQFNIRAGRPFASAAVRQAFAYSIDHDALVGQATGASQGFPVLGDINPTSWAAGGAIQYQLDATHAAQLLHGAHPAASIIFPSSDAQRASAAAIIAQQTVAAGFALQPDGVSDPAFQSALSSGAFDAAVVSVSTGLDPDNASLFATGGALNYGGYSNPALDALVASELNAAAAGTDLQQARKPIFARIEQAVSRDLPWYFLWAPRHYMGFSATLGGVSAVGVQLDADRTNSFYLDWFVAA
ncbi:MAG TPA: ABC transporter substrate-binding protein [Steroidobacteraceae bacterium]|nr:ABC transporter substrate-binding protein [Steroidobacteraceae bacterium]